MGRDPLVRPWTESWRIGEAANPGPSMPWQTSTSKTRVATWNAHDAVGSEALSRGCGHHVKLPCPSPGGCPAHRHYWAGTQKKRAITRSYLERPAVKESCAVTDADDAVNSNGQADRGTQCDTIAVTQHVPLSNNNFLCMVIICGIIQRTHNPVEC